MTPAFTTWIQTHISHHVKPAPFSLLPLPQLAGVCSHLSLPMPVPMLFPTNVPGPNSGLFQYWGINSGKDLEDNKGMKQ